MTTHSRVPYAALSAMALTLLFSSCSKDDNTFEKAGEKVDETLEKAGEHVDEAAKKTGEVIEEAGDKVKDATDGKP